MVLETLGITVNPFFLVGTGFIAGTLAALFGIGGGILVTPFLNMFGAPMTAAVATSVNYIAGTSMVATIRNRRWGNLNVKAGIITAAFMLPTIELSSQLMRYLESLDSPLVDSGIRVGFISSILVTLVLVARKKDGQGPGKPAAVRTAPVITFGPNHSVSLWILAPGAMVAGVVAGMFGLGGGRILVPLFLTVVALDTKVAVGTSSFVILLSSLYGSVTYGLKGLVDYPAVGLLLAGSLAGAFVGSAALNAFAGATIRKLYLVLSVAAVVSLLLKQGGRDALGIIVLATTCVGLAVAAFTRSFLLKSKKTRV